MNEKEQDLEILGLLEIENAEIDKIKKEFNKLKGEYEQYRTNFTKECYEKKIVYVHEKYPEMIEWKKLLKKIKLPVIIHIFVVAICIYSLIQSVFFKSKGWAVLFAILIWVAVFLSLKVYSFYHTLIFEYRKFDKKLLKLSFEQLEQKFEEDKKEAERKIEELMSNKTNEVNALADEYHSKANEHMENVRKLVPQLSVMIGEEYVYSSRLKEELESRRFDSLKEAYNSLLEELKYEQRKRQERIQEEIRRSEEERSIKRRMEEEESERFFAARRQCASCANRFKCTYRSRRGSENCSGFRPK